MTGVIRFLKALAILAIVVAVVYIGLQAAVGSDGIGITLIDVLLVPGDWFVPNQVTLADASTVVITGSTPGALWDTPIGERNLRVSGSTLMMDYGGESFVPVADDNTVSLTYGFPQSLVQQSAGWQVVRLQQVERQTDPAAAFVVVDLTKRVWLYRTGPLSWRQIPIP
jgi:hypothetical protein